MADEAVLKQRMSNPIDFIVDNSTGIEKGTVMKLSTARLAAASSVDGEFFAGIAHREKIALDGRVRLALFIDGVFDMTVSSQSDTITAGQMVKMSGVNLIAVADDDAVETGGEVVGKALEDSTAFTESIIEVLVGR